MRRLSVIALLATALAAPLVAQQGQQPPPPTPQQQQPPTAQPGQQPPPPPARGGMGRGTRAPGSEQSGQPAPGGRGMRPDLPTQNVRLDVTITDSAEKTQKKVISMLMADGESGRIRSANNVGVLNVDGNSRVGPDGRVHVWITIEYMPDRSATTTNLNQSISLVLAAGKPTLVSQSADPGTDRKVAVEVTATVVK
jgi:hypothetical protein